ncbi:MAG TPA: SPFH domain-containing protein, partial [Polyangiaceae bacterium LLY-WYZ-15_(1-7)]|nr:SPFH domain-containing protein [Polyangiaceae bacterium LLY-WYZ-15_(1-7)]
MGAGLALIGIGFIGVVAVMLVVRNLLYVCQPNEVLVFSGRRRDHGGLITHYRIVKGGRAVRWPLIETVDKVDLTNMIIEVTVRNAYSKGGIPLTVQGVANIKIPGEMPLIHNALERFLGRSREDLMRVGRETLEGNLRGVLAGLTPEEVNRDKEAFAAKLTDEAGHDLEKIGLVLDTLNIQNVSDEVGYLDAIGRMRAAAIRRDAQIAEATAQADAAEVKWSNYMQGEVAKLEAAIEVARKENERRIADARTKREAMIAEQHAEVQALLAQAQAELAMQDARIAQVKLQLEADIVRPAEAQRDQAIARARADASKIIEQGRATADVLRDLATSYRGQGNAGRDVLLMQKLVPVLQQVAGTIQQLRVDRLTVIGGGDSGLGGSAGAAGGGGKGAGLGGLAGTLVSAQEQIKAATGIDVAGVIKEHVGTGEAPKKPRRPRP